MALKSRRYKLTRIFAMLVKDMEFIDFIFKLKGEAKQFPVGIAPRR